MHSESWGGPQDPRERRGGHRGYGRERSRRDGPFPGGPGGPFEFGMRGGPFGPPRFGQPWNGYQIIQEIGARTEGVWRPSAGSVYPALQQLEDEALIKTQRDEAGEDRRRMYTLTEEGQAYVTEHADELRASWDAVTGSVGDAEVQLRSTIKQVMVAVSQVAQAGSTSQVAQAGKILADARRALYRILASDGEEAGEDTQG